MTDEQKLAFAKLLNLVMALAVDANFSEQSHKDIWSIAESFDISKIDLLRASGES